MESIDRCGVLFWVFTGLLAVVMVGSAARALLDYPWARESFVHLGYPTYIIIPLEIAKLFGVAAVVSNVSAFLKNLAYAGFFYHLLLALSAHVAAGDGPEMMVASASALVFLAGSFLVDRRRMIRDPRL